MNKKTEYVTNGISMLPKDWEIVDEVAKRHGNGRSSAMRLIVRNHPVAERMMALGQAYLLDLVTAEEALERLTEVVMHLPLPISITEKGQEMLRRS
jgi:hypothetical protein